MTEIDPLKLIEPMSYSQNGLPHDEWAWLRNNAPVEYFETPGWPSFWAITKHADIVEISKQPEVYPSPAGDPS